MHQEIMMTIIQMDYLYLTGKPFTKCTDCTKYKLEKEKTMDKRKRSEIENLLKMHLELVW